MIGKTGGIGIILNILRIHIDDVDMCKIGCCTLDSIINFNGPLTKELCKLGGLYVVLNILRTHLSNEAVVNCCCNILINVVMFSQIFDEFFTQEHMHEFEVCYKKQMSSDVLAWLYFLLIEKYN